MLGEVRDAFGMSGATAGLLTSLPVLAFAVFGAVAPTAARLVGVHRVTLLALLAVGAGLLGRALTHSEALFLLLSLLAVAGMAMANVLLPSLIKLHFPTRIGAMTAAYTTALAVGLTASLALTVPVAEAFGGWRTGLGLWAVVAFLAALPWLGLVAHDRRPDDAPAATVVRYADVARTPLGLAMALFFGLQSLQAYAVFGWFAQLWRDSGWSPTAAGLLVALIAAVSIPLSLWLPRLLASRERPAGVLLAVIACYPVGYLGLILAPYSLAPLWALLVGTAACTFPLILTLVGLRARTAEGTAALSAFTQSAGYLLAAVGPFAIGVVHDATGGWRWPVALLLVLSLPLAPLAAYVARPHAIEDQLRA
ncbi:MFS transporter [Nocardioides sp. zg-578]|uniref:MFS transporter n=1 Tax=Nocardioides marmotae TaxID=2663857 RepID=A0A6I3JG56_9ACTN|nr:MFS transporter [Nocardioides marmotae]MCR6033451.1 MFS transporter [Gordonia jinghuaiqii]MTB85782.1 MFS transporter [Nocardioides marmotae]MTB97109.1 MFS transporter [Nocardioides marmotae]QKE03394.1 MFS transporter [Nocardioides marmotae]